MKTLTWTRIVSTLLIVIALAGCATTTVSPTVAPTRTSAPVAATPTRAPAAAPTATSAAPAGQAFSFSGVQVTLPTGVASGATGQVVPAAQGADLPEFGKHPAYREIKLNSYPVQNDEFQGMIQVLPVADYEKISQTAAERVQALKALLAQKPAAPAQEIPVLPVYNAAQVFRAQVQYVSFGNGNGVRFVTLYSQGIMPVTNKNLFYTYQGLTADGAYWVSAILPVSAAFLPADATAAANPPAGGIAFPATPTEMNAYYRAVTDKLNGTPAAQFTPSLAALDTMMQSLRVAAP